MKFVSETLASGMMRALIALALIAVVLQFTMHSVSASAHSRPAAAPAHQVSAEVASELDAATLDAKPLRF